MGLVADNSGASKAAFQISPDLQIAVKQGTKLNSAQIVKFEFVFEPMSLPSLCSLAEGVEYNIKDGQRYELFDGGALDDFWYEFIPVDEEMVRITEGLSESE